MRIVFLPLPEGDVIAREDQLGRLEADFIVAAAGQVFYRHPHDRSLWFAAPDSDTFRRTAEAWNRYADEAQQGRREEAGADAVNRLRQELLHLGVLENGPNQLWQALLEQAEDGLL